MANPVLGRTFEQVGAGEESMTLGGTVNRSLMLLAILFVGAFYAWKEFFGAGGIESQAALHATYKLATIGLLGGLIAFVVVWISPRMSPYAAPAYAACEGLLIGAVSAIAETQFPGMVLQAVALTFTATFTIFFLYRVGVIRVTNTFMVVIFTMTGAVALFYIAALVGRMMFGVQFPLIYDSGMWGIAFSVFVVGLASFNLAIDFELIKQRIAARDPKWVEWYSAFALMVTLVWLYLEILRLLSKLKDR